MEGEFLIQIDHFAKVEGDGRFCMQLSVGSSCISLTWEFGGVTRVRTYLVRDILGTEAEKEVK
jgi:hypothetical protein